MALPKYAYKTKRNDGSMAKARGTAQPVKNPTGRLVVTDTGSHPNANVAQVVHWLPADGTEWECPKCGEWFRRDEDRRRVPWRQVIA